MPAEPQNKKHQPDLCVLAPGMQRPTLGMLTRRPDHRPCHAQGAAEAPVGRVRHAGRAQHCAPEEPLRSSRAGAPRQGFRAGQGSGQSSAEHAPRGLGQCHRAVAVPMSALSCACACPSRVKPVDKRPGSRVVRQLLRSHTGPPPASSSRHARCSGMVQPSLTGCRQCEQGCCTCAQFKTAHRA